MKSILSVVEHYLPGYRAGGPVRTIANLVERLGNEFQFRILTSDRDLGEKQPYPVSRPGIWQTVGKAQVLYLTPQKQRLAAWRRILNETEAHVIYLNSCFSRLAVQTMLLRKAGQIPDRPIVLAPRGELSKGALGLKRFKKRTFLTVAERLGLYEGVLWQASSQYEQRDILSVFASSGLSARDIVVAPDLIILTAQEAGPASLLAFNKEGRPDAQQCLKARGSVRIVFLSRIARKKNLSFALQLLSLVAGEVSFDIYGPIEDQSYWEECRALMRRLPTTVHAGYRGPVPPQEVSSVFSQYHLFLFPTLAENYGHVILEALHAGCPVMVSDQTPWQDLAEKQAGWVFDLDSSGQFVNSLQELVAMDEGEFRRRSEAAHAYALSVNHDPRAVDANRQLFLRALRQMCES